MSEIKTYYAFISYNHADKKEANDLQHWLEYYRLPNAVRSDNANLPKYVRPVFRDTTHLEIGELSEQIQEALKQSEFLIVVCSPNAAQSEWVNKEIEYFISIGKQSNIIPYIISGIPYAKDSQEECYPPAFKEITKGKEILGANIHEVGKESAAIRIVAKMFNLRQEVLWQRYQRDRKRKLWAIIFGIIAIFLFLLSFIGYAIYINSKLEEKNDKIQSQNERLRTDSIIMASQMDSIIHRDSLIIIQKHSIEAKNLDLNIANHQLEEERDKVVVERDNVKAANWKMMENQARAAAAIAHKCIEDGDIRAATLIALSVLPQNMTKPNRPWTIEADTVLRAAMRYSILKGHTDKVWEAKYCHDGSLVASASSDNTVRIWDVQTKKCLHVLRGHTQPVRSVSFQSNDQYLASASIDSTLRIWSTQTGAQLSQYNLCNESLWQVTYSHDGSKLAVMASDSVYVLNSSNAMILCKIGMDSVDYYFSSVAFSPSDEYIVTSYDIGVNVWNISNGEVLHTFRMDNEFAKIRSANFSSDGEQIVMALWDHSIRVWDLKTRKQKLTLLGHTEGVDCAQFSPDGNHVASCSKDQTIRVWNRYSGALQQVVQGHRGSVYDVSFSPDGGFLLSASSDSTIRISPFQNGFVSIKRLEKDTIITISGNKILIHATIPVNSILKNIKNGNLKSPNNQLIAKLDNKTIHIHNALTEDKMHILAGHTGRINTICFSSGSKYLLSASNDNTTRLWNIVTGECELVINDLANFSSVDFNSNDTKMLITENDQVRLWDVKQKQCVQIIDNKNNQPDISKMSGILRAHYFQYAEDKEILFARFSDDDKYIIIYYDENVKICPVEPIQDVIDNARKLYRNQNLTSEESRKYYLE